MKKSRIVIKQSSYPYYETSAIIRHENPLSHLASIFDEVNFAVLDDKSNIILEGEPGSYIHEMYDEILGKEFKIYSLKNIEFVPYRRDGQVVTDKVYVPWSGELHDSEVYTLPKKMVTHNIIQDYLRIVHEKNEVFRRIGFRLGGNDATEIRVLNCVKYPEEIFPGV